ncbi:MAG: hypothetical protein H7A09_04005 [Oceanospirillaceae bacterium]|nr:hypothetical protein [Oceanospirillaceae bacterium]MCP5335250.1 hypothetical protein [Oceanospirillaceae bacterium]
MRFKFLALAAYLVSVPTLADVSGEVTFASDYMDHGVSNSDHQPVVQIGMAYEHDSGLYTGFWSSPFDNGVNQGYAINLEFGYGRDVGDVGLSGGLLRHLFMGDKELKDGEFNEFYAAAAWADSVLTVLYSNDGGGTGARQITTELSHSIIFDDTLFNIMLADLRSLDEDKLLMDDNGDYQFMQLSLGREYKRWYGEVALHMNNLNT